MDIFIKSYSVSWIHKMSLETWLYLESLKNSWCVCICKYYDELTHWGRATHICVIEISIIGSDNGLSPGRRQAIIWTNACVLLIRTLGTNFSENFIGIQTFLFKKMHIKMSSAKWGPFCLGLNVLMPTKCGYRLTEDCKSNAVSQYSTYHQK